MSESSPASTDPATIRASCRTRTRHGARSRRSARWPHTSTHTHTHTHEHTHTSTHTHTYTHTTYTHTHTHTPARAHTHLLRVSAGVRRVRAVHAEHAQACLLRRERRAAPHGPDLDGGHRHGHNDGVRLHLVVHQLTAPRARTSRTRRAARVGWAGRTRARTVMQLDASTFCRRPAPWPGTARSRCSTRAH